MSTALAPAPRAATVRAATVRAATVRAATGPLAPVTRLRLTPRGRVVLTTLAAAPLVLGAVVFALNGGAAGASDSATGIDLMSYTTQSGMVTTLAYSPTDVGSARYITVEPGQTLWTLAEEFSPAADPRDVIADIKALNALSVETLQPGQRLKIPANS